MTADDWRKLADWLFVVFKPADARSDLRAQVNAAQKIGAEGPPPDVLNRLEIA